MKKQEMHPEKDQHRSSDKHQPQDKSFKSKPSPEEKTNQKASRVKDADEQDSDYTSYEKQNPQKDPNRQQSNDSRKVKP